MLLTKFSTVVTLRYVSLDLMTCFDLKTIAKSLATEPVCPSIVRINCKTAIRFVSDPRAK